MVIQIDNLLSNAIINLSPFIHVELCMLCYPVIIHIHTNYSILFKLPSRLDFLRLSVISSIYQNTYTTNTRGYKARFSIKILSYHFLIESYTFFCIFCQARPCASLHDRQSIPRNAHATVGPGDEAGLGGKLVYFWCCNLENNKTNNVLKLFTRFPMFTFIQ